jgi:thymidylate synthase (FAD)
MHVSVIGVTQPLIEPFSLDGLIEHAGRVCYNRTDSDGKNTAAFIKARLKEGHESIIEHCVATFEITGISRACSHQIVRHRISSVSQESQRYVDMSECSFTVPPEIACDEEALCIWNKALDMTQLAYRMLRRRGITKENARMLLPQATQTRMVFTANFRELRHFFNMRCQKAAQWEIREVAKEMLRLMNDFTPNVFGDLFQKYCG